MNQLSIFWEPPCDVDGLRRQLADLFDLRFVGVNRIQDHEPDQYTILHANLKDPSRVLELKEWLTRKPKHGKVICIVDRASHIEETRAFSIGANDVVYRPIVRRDLLAKLWGDFTQVAGDGSAFAAQGAEGVAAAFDSLQRIFASAALGEYLNQKSINSAGEKIVEQIGSHGLASWIDTVRKHHSQTYQHCLLVTGLAVGFGQQLGLSHNDRLRLSFAGMMHDVGKARIPVAILEKPGPLTPDEMAEMRNHPQYGKDALATVPGFPSEMLDIVLHHHEYLDGSGYPHGLQAAEISDLVRIMTIADVFGALIERRAYKPPLSGETAYQILLDMGPKLDKDLLREFRPVSLLGRH